MSKRKLQLDKYGISKKRYKELCGFCEQYPEWKAKIREFSFIKGVSYSQSPKSITNSVHSATEDAVIKLERYMENCQMVEDTAIEADPEFWQCLIRSVCYGASIRDLIDNGDLFLSERSFYNRRRYFFYLLDKKRE